MRFLIRFTFCFLLGTPSIAQTVDSNAVDGFLYVRSIENSPIDFMNYNNTDPVLNLIWSSHGVTNVRLPFGGLTNELDRTFEFAFTNIASVDSLIIKLESLNYVEYAEKKPLYRTSLIPNDIQPSQWGLTKIQAAEAWNFTTGDANVKIAIVDNAVSTVHEDLQANIWANPGEIPNNGIDDDLNGFVDDVQGFDVSDNDPNPNPPAGSTSSSAFVHGTHCAGIASAKTNNGVGIASLGYNTTIIGVKCAPDGSLSQGNELPNAFDGVYYALRAEADVISMSWGGTGLSLTGESLMTACNSAGIVLIAAAGNSDTTQAHFPAAYPNVISVGSTNTMDVKSWFSNYGSTIDVMAPGSGIYSTLSGTGNEYGVLSGTSMACPLVAGLAGLVLAVNPSFDPSQVEQAIKDGCEPIDVLNPGYEGQLGAGRINAFNTLNTLANLQETSSSALVYPNPSSGKVFITGTNELTDLSLVSIAGRKTPFSVTKISASKYEVQIDGEQGMYVLTAISDGTRITRKIYLQP